MDYPLAPAVTLPGILEDVLDSVNRYEEVLTAAGLVTEERNAEYFYGRERFRYFRVGTLRRRLPGTFDRRLGKGLPFKPAGILSYYGYGLPDGRVV